VCARPQWTCKYYNITLTGLTRPGRSDIVSPHDILSFALYFITIILLCGGGRISLWFYFKIVNDGYLYARPQEIWHGICERLAQCVAYVTAYMIQKQWWKIVNFSALRSLPCIFNISSNIFVKSAAENQTRALQNIQSRFFCCTLCFVLYIL